MKLVGEVNWSWMVYGVEKIAFMRRRIWRFQSGMGGIVGSGAGLSCMHYYFSVAVQTKNQNGVSVSDIRKSEIG
jgi:hypothetical protein